MEIQVKDFSLREATADDLPRLVEIEDRVHVAPWTEAHFEEELAKPYSETLLYTDDETDEVIVGYVVFWLMFDECQILNVAVDLPFRRRGFAQRLIGKALQMALQKNIRRIFLNVRKSNIEAIQLYQGLKFGITHVRKGFYSDGEDAYEMTLDLTGAEVIEF